MGWTMTTEEQRAFLDLARRRHTWIIADEVHNRIVYDDSIATPSFVEVADEHAPSINSTGSAAFVQHAGVAAFQEGEHFVDEMRARCAVGRDMVQDAFRGNARILAPNVPAAFYSFPSSGSTASTTTSPMPRNSSPRPERASPPAGGVRPNLRHYFRICFAQSPARLAEALDRLVAAV